MLNLILPKRYCFVLVLVTLNLDHVFSEIFVYKNTSTEKVVRVITDYELSIGADIPEDGVLAYIVSAEPENACKQIKPPPQDPFGIGNSSFNWYVLVDRDSCAMTTKLKNVKLSGYSGVIIYNAKMVSSSNPAELTHGLDDFPIDFPVLLVTHIDGQQIKKFYTYEKGYFAWFFNNSPFHIYPFLVPFLFVIGACIIVIISFMISQIIRCYNERRKRQRHRLAKRDLKKIPTIKFKKGDHYDICAICLNEFKEGVKLRLLNCGHAYHLKCIDPWLTGNRRNCPICKGKVVVPDVTDSESENDARNNASTERTPLLNNNNQQTSGGYSNNLIFPIGRRSRTSDRTSNNVISTSNIVNNDLVVNVSTPNLSTQSTSTILPSRSNRKTGRRRTQSHVNAEINSLIYSMFNEQPTTSSTIDIEDASHFSSTFDATTSTSISNTSTHDVTTQNVSPAAPSTSQAPSNSTHGSTERPTRRQDNIV